MSHLTRGPRKGDRQQGDCGERPTAKRSHAQNDTGGRSMSHLTRGPRRGIGSKAIAVSGRQQSGRMPRTTQEAAA